ncbi:iron-containing redox enzyme family protein [Streptomyces sp. DSM 41527]|uniref:Iron-containing redox enzyme family protein n=1 Tax=Streptomyces mooreae TaxID=3075523 RepID=A0ABU2THJ3_9ACTN|nr:iron-containing redox enzyme family protein [Streptomyces sp. DSM 41527]MDT0460392.1 iron-containing redox enzyme family protein [Streptomyces sp. DSM 41527]
MQCQQAAAGTAGRRPRAVAEECRTLYAEAADPEGFPPRVALPDEYSRALTASARTLEDWERRAGAWSARAGDDYRALAARAADQESRDALVRRAALGAAPLALVSGAWLQWLSSPGNGDSELTMRTLALYAQDLGAGHPGADRGSAYRALLHHLRLAERAAPATRLTQDPQVSDLAFALPGPLLAMSRRPDEHRAELVGADLCLRAAGLLPPLALVRELLPAAADWTALDPGAARRADTPTGLALARAAAAALPAGSPDAPGLIAGFRWALDLLQRWSSGLYEEVSAALDPAHDMAELLRLRAREAALYHQEFKVAGRPLGDWFAEARTAPHGLLRALAASRLVRPGSPERSPLLRGLISENGPMFRIFSPADEAVIRRWIRSLPAGAVAVADRGGQATDVPVPVTAMDTAVETTMDTDTVTVTVTVTDPDPNPAPSPDTTRPLPAPAAVRAPAARRDRSPGTLREAYHLLLSRGDTPALRRYATGYVHGWLARSRVGWDTAGHLPPHHWDPRGLRPWLQEQHDRHGREFEQGAGAPVPSREALVDATVQLAPLTLIDGSWLQGFTDYGHASSDVGHLLFSTYWDELGNGDLGLNHPLIYREVLREMGVELPPTASREFAQWPGFREESFELPVYWLCIGRLPRTFLPEVLGLNVAMELSGVGGGYRRARIGLEAYGFSTRFVDIHNTIDNVATGHSAWAADAVDAYMATVPSVLGPGCEPGIWERVRTGYRSLNPPGGRRARRAARHATRAYENRRPYGNKGEVH